MQLTIRLEGNCVIFIKNFKAEDAGGENLTLLERKRRSLKYYMHLMNCRERTANFFARPSNISQKYGSQVASFLEARLKFLSCFVYKSLALIILEKVSERVSRSIWSVYYSLMKKTRCVCLVGEAS